MHTDPGFEGYQRAFSGSRVSAIKTYIKNGNPIPGAIIVALDEGRYKEGTLSFPASNDAGWVIDGQHRLIGAHLAAADGVDVELPVVAFKGIDEQHQIEQFITINREAKNVPTSLYLDLLGKLSWKKPADFAKERTTDIAAQLRRDEDSPLYERIAVVTSPTAQQISLVNFVRKIAPYVTPDKGILGTYTEREQRRIVDNQNQGQCALVGQCPDFVCERRSRAGLRPTGGLDEYVQACFPVTH